MSYFFQFFSIFGFAIFQTDFPTIAEKLGIPATFAIILFFYFKNTIEKQNTERAETARLMVELMKENNVYLYKTTGQVVGQGVARGR